MSGNLPAPGSALRAMFRHECALQLRNRSELYNPLLFFTSIIVFVPLGISPEAGFLKQLAPGMVWIIALLSVLLSLDRVFQADFEDGSLEQALLSGQSGYMLVLAKVLVHWLFTGLPLTLLSPVLGIMLALPAEAYGCLMLSLFFGSGALCFIGAVGAALTVSLRRGGLLLSLIIIPLYVPVLIFGSGAVSAAAIGDSYGATLAVVVAFWLAALMLAPFAALGALKINLAE